jgi:hypothetical protein
MEISERALSFLDPKLVNSLSRSYSAHKELRSSINWVLNSQNFKSVSGIIEPGKTTEHFFVRRKLLSY